MLYSLNIESGLFTNNFRLQNDKQWLKCLNPKVISTKDYNSSNPIDIINLQIKDIQITINSEVFDIQSEDGLELMDETQLNYSVYGFRKVYPKSPDANQLEQLLTNGNDTQRNILVLKTDGLFYLLTQNQILDGISNPEYVLQFEAFQPGNNYVGLTTNRDYTQDLYKKSIYHWKKHLIDKELHDFAEIVLSSENKLPAILDLFDELNVIKNNWRADY
jgi:hypothetical protein